MTTLDEILTTILDEDDIERIDRLAEKLDLTRERMVSKLVRTGLSALEDGPPASERRPRG